MPTRVRVQRERIVNVFDNLRQGKFDNGIMQVGIVDPDLHYSDGTNLADVAAWVEFGTSRIPPRPALRRSVSRMAPKLIALGAEQAVLMLHGKLRFDVAVRRQARLLAADMQKAIRSLRTPPNAPSTIARKGFNNPLIDTELYVKSISFKLLKTRKDQL